MSKKKKLIPKLRFPEFVNKGKWELKQVEEFFDVGSSKRVLQKDWTNQGVPFYRTRELVSLSRNEPFGSEIYISESLYKELKEQYGVPKEGDFLVSGVGTLGISYQVKVNDKFYFKDGNVLWFKLDGDLDSSYFKFCFESEHIQNHIKEQTSKSTVGTYTIKNAKKTEFWYPRNTHEQQRIASCLSSLDELIAAHNEKLDALKDHKKGLMQNLFPQEGQKVPNYRFPEFENDGEWVEKALHEVAEIITGNTPSTKESSYYGGEKMFVSPADISDNRMVNKTKTTLTEFGFSKTRHVKAMSVLFVCIGSTIGKVAQNLFECATNQQINSLMVVNKNSSEFLYSNLEHNASKIATIAGNQAVPIINKSLFSSVELLFPPKPKEQEKIAACLSALDEFILAQEEKIKQLQQHKKGLLQGLFPKIKS